MISRRVVQITQGRKKPDGMPRGRAGILPAVFRILRNTCGRRERCVHKLTSAVCCAGRAALQAGRPRSPRQTSRILEVSGEVLKMALQVGTV